MPIHGYPSNHTPNHFLHDLSPSSPFHSKVFKVSLRFPTHVHLLWAHPQCTFCRHIVFSSSGPCNAFLLSQRLGDLSHLHLPQIIKLDSYTIMISSFSSSSYSQFFVGSMFDDIRLHVVRSYTSSPDSPFSLISPLTLSNHPLLVVLPLFLLPGTSFPSLSFLRSASFFTKINNHGLGSQSFLIPFCVNI